MVMLRYRAINRRAWRSPYRVGEIIEHGYRTYRMNYEVELDLTDNIIDVCEMFLFVMPMEDIETMHKSHLQIEKMRKDIRRGDIFPPVIVSIQQKNTCRFDTVVDGMHRILAHNLEGKRTIRALLVKRLS